MCVAAENRLVKESAAAEHRTSTGLRQSPGLAGSTQAGGFVPVNPPSLFTASPTYERSDI